MKIKLFTTIVASLFLELSCIPQAPIPAPSHPTLLNGTVALSRSITRIPIDFRPDSLYLAKNGKLLVSTPSKTVMIDNFRHAYRVTNLTEKLNPKGRNLSIYGFDGHFVLYFLDRQPAFSDGIISFGFWYFNLDSNKSKQVMDASEQFELGVPDGVLSKGTLAYIRKDGAIVVKKLNENTVIKIIPSNGEHFDSISLEGNLLTYVSSNAKVNFFNLEDGKVGLLYQTENNRIIRANLDGNYLSTIEYNSNSNIYFRILNTKNNFEDVFNNILSNLSYKKTALEGRLISSNDKYCLFTGEKPGQLILCDLLNFKIYLIDNDEKSTWLAFSGLFWYSEKEESLNYLDFNSIDHAD